MMIGPAPMIRTVWMSVRLGIKAARINYIRGGLSGFNFAGFWLQAAFLCLGCRAYMCATLFRNPLFPVLILAVSLPPRLNVAAAAQKKQSGSGGLAAESY